jgi:hypothetical protein
MHSHGQDSRLRAFGFGTARVWNHGGGGGPALPAVYTRIFPRPAAAVYVAVVPLPSPDALSTLQQVESGEWSAVRADAPAHSTADAYCTAPVGWRRT